MSITAITSSIKKRRGKRGIQLPEIALLNIGDLFGEKIAVNASVRITKNLSDAVEVGVVYGESPEPTIDDNIHKIDGVISSNMSDIVTSILPGKEYHFRAYAKNEKGEVGYSEEELESNTPFVKLSEPHSLYLTYSDNPQTSVDIMFPAFTVEYSENEPTPEEANREIFFRKEGETEWDSFQTDISGRWPYTGFNFNPDDFGGNVGVEMYVTRLKMTGLDPNTVYEFKIGETGDVEKFQTVRDDFGEETPLKIIFGGDIQHMAWQNMTETKVKENPDFIVLGGDNAAADNSINRFERWDQRMWEGVLPLLRKDSNGHIIPIVPQIGNHEVLGGYSTDLDDAMMHYTAFPWHREIGGYGTLDVPGILSIALLNSMHTAPVITGTDAQSLWMKDTLPQKKSSFPHVVISAHVTHFGPHRGIDYPYSVRQRQHWIPIYEDNDISLVFEGHDHVYSRSERLKNSAIDSNGVRYYVLNWGTGGRQTVINYRTVQWAQMTHATGVWVEGDEPDPTDGDPANPEQQRTYALCEFYTDRFIVHSVDEHGVKFDTYEKTL